MKKPLEFEGKNIEKALDKASAKLRLPKDRLKYNILSYGSSGIFGLAGTRKARIRVNVVTETVSTESDAAIETKEPVMDDPGRDDPGRDNPVRDDPVMDNPVRDNSETDDPVRDDPVTDNPVPAENIEETSTDDTNVAENDHTGQPDFDPDFDPDLNPDFSRLLQDSVEIGRSVLQRIIDAITEDARITVEELSDQIQYNVSGGNPAILIGKRGQTLEAIHSLVEKVVNKHRNNDGRIRVQVDIEGYLETRRENLEQLAQRLAEKAHRIKKPISMGQMSAHDRRIVHLALKETPNVNTQSRGEGYLRKLVIFPKRNRARKQKNSSY